MDEKRDFNNVNFDLVNDAGDSNNTITNNNIDENYKYKSFEERPKKEKKF